MSNDQAPKFTFKIPIKWMNTVRSTRTDYMERLFEVEAENIDEALEIVEKMENYELMEDGECQDTDDYDDYEVGYQDGSFRIDGDEARRWAERDRKTPTMTAEEANLRLNIE